jgi:NADPH:quinone reductase-like Zn-dependent oxidoreductase
VLRYDDMAEPAPGPGRCSAAARRRVNPFDTYMLSGTYTIAAPAYSPGADGAGVVEARAVWVWRG